ncbi:MAG: hypothetical protein R3E40_00245 [Rhodocyclaceae bacterium]
MRDGVGEGLQFLVGGSQFGRAFAHAILEGSIEVLDFLIRQNLGGDVLGGAQRTDRFSFVVEKHFPMHMEMLDATVRENPVVDLVAALRLA